MKIVEPDFERKQRCGIPEVVYGQYKGLDYLTEICMEFIEASGRVIVTKLDEKKGRGLLEEFRGDLEARFDGSAGVFVARKKGFSRDSAGCVGIISAGTSDIPFAQEARIILEELGVQVKASHDVGVAGVHRLYPALKQMTDTGCIIVAAGMEGALPSVVSGLVDVPVIGLPTSVGYGVGAGGKSALYGMLTSCTPIAVVNIDNGYGAAVLAYQIVRDR